MTSLLLTSACFANQTCSEPQMHQLADKAKKEINDRLYLTLATVDEHDSPWNAPVFSAFDSAYRFYWMSAVNSQHSQNIRLNHKTFAVIYDSTAAEGTGFGVYLSGKTHELNASEAEEIKHGINVMGMRIHRTERPSFSTYLPPFPRRVYRFTPEKIWVNTVVNIHGKNVDRRIDITRCLL